MSLTDEDSDEADFLEVSERNFKRTYNSVAKVGYADGVNDGQKSVFQDGFDRGYSMGLRTGFEIQKYKSFFNAININISNALAQLQGEANKYQEMAVPDAKSKHHLQLSQHMTEPLCDISKHQSDYIDKRLEEFKQTLPVANSFLTQT